MVVWSAISRSLAFKTPFQGVIANRVALCQKSKDLVIQVRHSGHGPEHFQIRPSSWQWDRFKDLLHFYSMVGLIPICGVITYVNIFIGPAKLAPIPENYEPQRWEYYKHPVTRFFARYIKRNPQQEYEKFCHEAYEESEKIRLKKLEKEVKRLMAERLDYQAWFYRPAVVKYARQSNKFFEESKLMIGQ